MVERIKYTVDTFGLKSKYFLDSTDYEEIFELINSQEKRIKIYNGTIFSNILVVEKKGPDFQFLMNTLTPTDRKTIEKEIDTFFDAFSEDGIWMYDMVKKLLIYDANKKEIYGDWRIFSKDLISTFLGMDGENTKPIKFYNAQSKSALYWAVFYINNYLSNPQGSLVEEAGVKIMLDFVCNLYNLEPFGNFSFNKQEIMNAIGVWEKEYEDVNEEFLTKFKKVYTASVSRKEPEKKVVTKEKEKKCGLILSSKGRVFLSDLIVNDIPPKDIIPIHIDLSVDSRVLGAFIEDGKVIFSTSVTFDNEQKQTLKNIMGDNSKFVEVKSVSELNNLMDIDEQAHWYDKIYPKGDILNGTF